MGFVPEIWFIHGAASSPRSFNWLKANLRPHTVVDVSYDSATPLIETINYLRDEVGYCTNPPVIIAHSLGGVIAAAVAQTVPVAKIATMGSPFGGSFAASVMRWFLPTQLMKDIAQQSPVLNALQKNPPEVPILSFVTDSGLTIMGERTDGVVTVRSQTALYGPTYITVPINHFEVLMSPEVSSVMNDFIFDPAPQDRACNFGSAS
jgi:pimeloyl-ACP methyl ester carboxylesterase